MRTIFVESLLASLLEDAVIAPNQSVLTVCATRAEHDVLRGLGFSDVTISNLDPEAGQADFAPHRWSYQDAMQLSFEDGTFDWAMVCDGLHHCSSPHTALLEMYRVARRGVIVVESRDSALVRLGVKLKLTGDYEVAAVEYNGGEQGGVNNSDIPNHVYRWTEREFEKTIRSHDPTGRHTFLYRYGFSAPDLSDRPPAVRIPGRFGASVLERIVPRVAKRQGNTFAMIALKPAVPGELWPWLRYEDGAVHYRGPS